MNMIADFVKSYSQSRSSFKLSLIVEQSIADSAELYKSLSMDSHVHVKLCFDMKEAEAWVGS